MSGPAKAPTVSSDWRSPKAAPRSSGGAMSATSASRRAPRDALAHPVDEAGGESGFERGRQRKLAACHQLPPGHSPEAPAPCDCQRSLGTRRTARDLCGRLGDSLEKPGGATEAPSVPTTKSRRMALDHLGGHVHEKADKSQHPDAAGQVLGNIWSTSVSTGVCGCEVMIGRRSPFFKSCDFGGSHEQDAHRDGHFRPRRGRCHPLLGAQAQRSIGNFKIGSGGASRLPVVRALGIVERAAAGKPTWRWAGWTRPWARSSSRRRRE